VAAKLNPSELYKQKQSRDVLEAISEDEDEEDDDEVQPPKVVLPRPALKRPSPTQPAAALKTDGTDGVGADTNYDYNDDGDDGMPMVTAGSLLHTSSLARMGFLLASNKSRDDSAAPTPTPTPILLPPLPPAPSPSPTPLQQEESLLDVNAASKANVAVHMKSSGLTSSVRFDDNMHVSRIDVNVGATDAVNDTRPTITVSFFENERRSPLPPFTFTPQVF
jgi:hypothetical protein